MPWRLVLELTKSGPAKYFPRTLIESLERYVWDKGIPSTKAPGTKVMEFGQDIGASSGKGSRWVLVEETGGTIHGRPIDQATFRSHTK